MGKTPQVRVIFYHLYFFLLVPLSVLNILWSYNIYLKQIKMSYFYLFSQLMHWRLSWLKWTGWILWLCWKGPYLTMVTFQAPEVLQMIALCARKRRMVKFSPIWPPPPPFLSSSFLFYCHLCFFLYNLPVQFAKVFITDGTPIMIIFELFNFEVTMRFIEATFIKD